MRHARLAASCLATFTTLATLAALAAPAAADPTALHASAPALADGFGARVGGYGFRRDRGGTRSAWDECRMNGLGVFADHALRGPLFVEAGLDLYFSESFPQQRPAGDLPIDRSSGLLSAAIGARAQFTGWLRGYVQLGAGVEATRVAVPYGDAGVMIRDTKVMPEGFLGLGGDLRVGSHTYVGANLRTLVMGNFDYDPTKLQMTGTWPVPPSADAVFAAAPGVAAQAQFYLRREL
jgi:hypothetical protein